MKSFIHNTAFVGKSAILNHPVHISKNAEIHNGSSIDRFSFMNVGTVIYANVVIGKFCSFARNVEVAAAEHPIHFLSTHSFQYDKDYSSKYQSIAFQEK